MARLGWVGRLFEGVVVLFLVAMIAGQVLGQPVLLGFVTTGSMEPTLDPGDGFVAVPSALAGDVEEGDVITFRAEEIQGGGLTTHRIVEVTDRGFVTKGDNNPFTDQDGGEPPVKRSQVVAVAWRPGGSVLAIPGVGTVVSVTQDALGTVQRRLAGLFGTRSLLGTQGLAYLVLAVSLVGYLTDIARESGHKERQRDTSRNSGTSGRLLLLAFAGAVVIAATATMIVPAGPQEFGIVSSESDSPGIRVIERGTNETARYVLGNGGAVPVVTYFEPTTAGIDIQPRETVIPGQSSVNATLTLSAPPETGYYRRFVVEHRYLLVLPQPVIRGLYEVHPWLPIVAIDALIGSAFYLVGAVFLGTGRVRDRTRDGPSELDRIRSRLSSRGPTRPRREGDE